jgi:hypothetical protein
VTRQHVPPGQGKASTRSRNLRRRQRKTLLKVSQTDDKTNENENSSASMELLDARVPGDRSGNAQKTDSVPGHNTSAASTVPEISPPVMMASLQTKNKNKRNRGPSSGIPIPRKIVFSQEGDDGEEISSGIMDISVQAPALPPQNSNVETKPVPSPKPRLITPSERQERGELPPDLFVTSHYCDEGDAWWNGTVTKKQRKRSHKAGSEADVKYDAPTSTTVGIDVDAVERSWDTYEEIKHVDQVQAGAVLGWRVRFWLIFSHIPLVCIG